MGCAHPSSWEAEAGVPRQPRLHDKTLSPTELLMTDHVREGMLCTVVFVIGRPCVHLCV